MIAQNHTNMAASEFACKLGIDAKPLGTFDRKVTSGKDFDNFSLN